MVLAIEIIVLWIICTIIVMVSTTRNPLGGIHNAHPLIQQRVAELPEYQYVKYRVNMPASKRIAAKIPAALVVALGFYALVWLAGADDFLSGWLYAFILWASIKLYISLVIHCLWYAHSAKARIPGTEDMDAAYKDYGFYLSSIPRSLLAGCVVAALIGLIVWLSHAIV